MNEKQQKLIKLADREQEEWFMVKEYLLDELAFESDYEKNIVKAKKSASQKRKETKNFKSKIL